MEYVFQGENCCFIFLGDEGQFLLVGINESFVLSSVYFQYYFLWIDFWVYGLIMVVRQESVFGILINVINVWNLVLDYLFKIDFCDFLDCKVVVGDELIQIIEVVYDCYGVEEVMIVMWLNKRVNFYNQYV